MLVKQPTINANTIKHIQRRHKHAANAIVTEQIVTESKIGAYRCLKNE